MIGFENYSGNPTTQSGRNRQEATATLRPRSFASEAQHSSSVLDNAKISVARWFADRILPPFKKAPKEVDPLSEDSFVFIESRDDDYMKRTPIQPKMGKPVPRPSTVTFSEESFVIIDDKDHVTPGGPTASINEIIDETSRMKISLSNTKIFNVVLNAAQSSNSNDSKEDATKQILPIRSRFGPQWKANFVQDIKGELDQIDSTLEQSMQSSPKRHPLDPMNNRRSNPVETALYLWKDSIASKIERQVDELMKISSNLLKECVSVVGLPKEATLVEKVRLKRLMEFCNTVHGLTTQRANNLKQLVQTDANKIFNEAQSPGAAKNIRGKMSEALISELCQLDNLVKDIDTSAATIIAALRTDPSDPSASPLCEMHRKRKTRDSAEVMKVSERHSPMSVQRSTAASRIIKKRRTAMPLFKQRSSPLRITSSTSLQDICIKSITDNIMDIVNLQFRLPDDLLQQIISELVSSHNICDDIIERIVSPFSQTLILDNCIQISDSSCALIGKLCRQLRKLSLRGCINISTEGIIKLSGSLPYLEVLDLSGCIDIESLGVQEILRNCPHLASLDLSGCVKLTDFALKEATLCPNLRHINIKGCASFSDGLFSYLGNDLQDLNIADCPNITDRGLKSLFGRSFNIVSLALSGKRITNDCIEILAVNCPDLRRLELMGCDALGDQSICILSHYCRSLEALNISFCKGISAQAFSNAQVFPRLQKLNLARCVSINDETIDKVIRRCPVLESLNVSSCQEITAASVHLLSNKCSEHLRHCDFSNCSSITNASILHLVQSCSLETLSLFNCFMISDVSVLEIAKTCNNLVSLDVSCCDVSDQSINALADSCTQLEVLCLEETKVTDVSLMNLAKSCHKIRSLKLSYCTELTDASLVALAEGCPDLKVLDLSYCNKISPSKLQECLNRWPKLSELNIRGFNNISNVGLVHSNLSVLNISWCKNLTDSGLAQIGKGCPSLSEVDMAWCGNVTEASVTSLIRDCLDLRCINLRGCALPTLSQSLAFNPKLRLYR